MMICALRAMLRKTTKKQNKNKKKPIIEPLARRSQLFFYVFIVSSMFFPLARSAPFTQIPEEPSE